MPLQFLAGSTLAQFGMLIQNAKARARTHTHTQCHTHTHTNTHTMATACCRHPGNMNLRKIFNIFNCGQNGFLRPAFAIRCNRRSQSFFRCVAPASPASDACTLDLAATAVQSTASGHRKQAKHFLDAVDQITSAMGAAANSDEPLKQDINKNAAFVHLGQLHSLVAEPR